MLTTYWASFPSQAFLTFYLTDSIWQPYTKKSKLIAKLLKCDIHQSRAGCKADLSASKVWCGRNIPWTAVSMGVTNDKTPQKPLRRTAQGTPRIAKLLKSHVTRGAEQWHGYITTCLTSGRTCRDSNSLTFAGSTSSSSSHVLSS